MAVSQMIGARIQRREDPRLITGNGRYVEDLQRAGTLHMAVVRSPHPHARITRVNTAQAQAIPGVVAVLTAADFKPLLTGTHPVAPAFVPEKHTVPERFPIADQEAVFQGEAVAVVIKERILQQRLAPTPMEPRGLVAEYNQFDDQLTIWMATQNPHFIRLFVAGSLGMPETKVRVVSHDVGGGFGSKISPYPEDYLIAAAAKLLKRPVRWIEDRTESLQTTTHGRGQIFDVEVAAKRDGSLLAMKVTQYLDAGAYVGTFGAFQPCACLLAGGAYRWPGGIAARTVGVLTNRVPTDPYRGAGRPEATHLVERMVDKVAAEIGMDPAEVRRKNFIQPNEFPYTSHFGLTYDSGNYPGTLERTLELVDYQAFRRQQEAARKEGRYLGIGFSTWIEICGL